MSSDNYIFEANSRFRIGDNCWVLYETIDEIFILTGQISKVIVVWNVYNSRESSNMNASLKYEVKTQNYATIIVESYNIATTTEGWAQLLSIFTNLKNKPIYTEVVR